MITKKAWLIANISCLITIIIFIVIDLENKKSSTYLIHPKKIFKIQDKEKTTKLKLRVNKPNSKKNKNKINNKILRYKYWKDLGKKLEQEKKYLKAMQCYNIALIYKKNSSLQKRAEILEKKIKTQLKKQNIYENAEKLERQGNYQAAYKAYKKIKPINNKIKKKIKQCLKMIHLENKLTAKYNSLHIILKKQSWAYAIVNYKKALKNSSSLLDGNKSLKLKKIIQKINKEYIFLRQNLNTIQKYIKQNRLGVAYNYVARLKTALPKNIILTKIRQKLLINMAFVAKGNFTIGSFKKLDEMPQQKMYLPSFYIDKYEVTNKEYLLFVKATQAKLPASWKNLKLRPKQYNKPVTGISWQEAATYAQWIGKRLPTEYEWEKSARGPHANIYPWGNHFIIKNCNSLEAHINKPTNVHSFIKGISFYKCFNMAGNVLEWTQSTYKPYPNGSHQPYIIKNNYKVARGGSWLYSKKSVYCSNRYAFSQQARPLTMGFRCAITLPEKQKN